MSEYKITAATEADLEKELDRLQDEIDRLQEENKWLIGENKYLTFQRDQARTICRESVVVQVERVNNLRALNEQLIGEYAKVTEARDDSDRAIVRLLAERNTFEKYSFALRGENERLLRLLQEWLDDFEGSEGPTQEKTRAALEAENERN